MKALSVLRYKTFPGTFVGVMYNTKHPPAQKIMFLYEKIIAPVSYNNPVMKDWPLLWSVCRVAREKLSNNRNWQSVKNRNPRSLPRIVLSVPLRKMYTMEGIFVTTPGTQIYASCQVGARYYGQTSGLIAWPMVRVSGWRRTQNMIECFLMK